jgi:hypothetical protein
MPMTALRMTRWLAGSVALALLLGDAMTASARTRDLNEAEGRRLLLEALEPTQRKLPGLVLKLYTRVEMPQFYRFEVYWDNPTPGSIMVGSFAVNKATGDVWELYFCKKKRSKELASMQRDLRKAIDMSPEELQKLTDKAPCER